MIQDIFPRKLNNSYHIMEPAAEDSVFLFWDEGFAARFEESSGELRFPNWGEIEDHERVTAVYLFSIDEERYYLIRKSCELPPEYEWYSMNRIRTVKVQDQKNVFAAFTAYHLWKWYITNQYCGVCGTEMILDDQERAVVCTFCGNKVYPRLNPAVIVGVTNGDRILITRYRTGYAHNALVAGFTEIGETMEETVAREVMEEAGLRVKNIRYYKSQPWGVAQDILLGYFCEVDGDDTINMDNTELKYAEWVERQDIELQPSDYSLTNEMMKVFKEGMDIHSV